METLLADHLQAVMVVWIVGFGFGGYLIGQGKGRGLDGLVWGLSFGPLGLVLVAVMRPSRQFLAKERRAELEDRRRAGRQ